MKRRPVEGAAKVPGQRALTVVAIPAQIAPRDMPTQSENGREQNGQELRLRLTNRRHLFEDGFDNCHGDDWFPVDFDFHSEPSHRLFCEALSSKSVRTIVIGLVFLT